MNNKQESSLDNLNRDKRDKFLNNLEMAKNLLTVAGDIATSVSPLKNISSAKYLIFMQSTSGGIIVDTAKGDTWDEQIVGIVGDFVCRTSIFICDFKGFCYSFKLCINFIRQSPWLSLKKCSKINEVI